MPAFLLSQKAFRNGGSVASCCVTWYCSGVSRFFRSASLGLEGFVIAPSPATPRAGGGAEEGQGKEGQGGEAGGNGDGSHEGWMLRGDHVFPDDEACQPSPAPPCNLLVEGVLRHPSRPTEIP